MDSDGVSLRQIQRQLPDLPVGFAHVNEVRKDDEIREFAQPEFAHAILGEILAFVADQRELQFVRRL